MKIQCMCRSMPGIRMFSCKDRRNTTGIQCARSDIEQPHREIIHRERMIELSFEGEPYWDLLRWKEAESEFKKPITGWNVKGENTTEYYEVKVLTQPQFSIKNYLFPIKQNSLDVNPNLIQNFGWGTSN